MIKRIAGKLWVLLFLLVATAFLAACLSPFLNPAHWWYFAFLGLLFPYLLLSMLFFLLYWLFKRSKWSLLVLGCLALGWKGIHAAFAVHFWSDFKMEKQEGTVRVMTWNIRYFMGPLEKRATSGISAAHQKMFDLIETYDPDIITMQEFVTGDWRQHAANLKAMENELGFTHHFFWSLGGRTAPDRKRPEKGIAIFSKYPIIDSKAIDLPYGGGTTEAVIYADIATGSDTIRVFAGHLQSFGFMGKDYENMNRIRNDPDARLDASKSVVRKMRTAFEIRGKQADHILKETEGSRYPEIFCADLNDVPNSYTYFTIKGNKRDAFVEKGAGFGKTFFSFHSGFMNRLPALRIDYILTDPQFTIHQMKRVKEVLSDHIPLVADVSLSR